MQCPKCGSRDVKRVSIIDPYWSLGGEKCNYCQYQDHWTFFCEDKDFAKHFSNALLTETPAEVLIERPMVGLATCVRKDGNVPLHKRRGKHAHGSWAFPGGHLEKWEAFEECALRELKEEAGDIEVKNLHFWTVVNTLYRDEDKHYVVVLMMADWVSGEPKVMEPDKCECWGWFDWDDPPQPLMQGLKILRDRGVNPYHRSQASNV